MKVPKTLYKNTVDRDLWNTLEELMHFPELERFRLVGGTALSLLLGHRVSVDIDLFTDAENGTIKFNEIDRILKKKFKILLDRDLGKDNFGKTYFVGNSEDKLMKLDFFYTDAFVFPLNTIEEIRIADIREILAMKLEAICNSKRKKDFWDLHELSEHFSFSEVLECYEKRYPFSYSKQEIIMNLNKIDLADDDFEPICLKNKYWELIKLDFQKFQK